ncbi:MAG: prepilin-type N-terminal cleavage/methylation domain-containing protein [Methylotenera sp.]
MKKIAARGFTLVEMLIVIAILGIVAKVAIPLLSSNDPQKLNVAAEETANTLRFAFSEAKRTNGYVLVDGKTTAGHLQLYYSDVNANLGATINDPLTKRPFDLNVASSAFSQGVTLTPQFRAGGSARTQLLIAPNVTQMWGFDGIGGNQGTLQANSGVLLTLGSQSVLVRINENTGLVTLP